MTIQDPVTVLRGVGEESAKKLESVGIKTIADLVNYWPRAYEDFSQITPIKQLRPGAVSIRATIAQIKGRYVRRGMHVTEAVASDETGSVRLVWFNQPYREDGTKKGSEYFISGNFELHSGRLAIMSPATELVSDFPTNTARIIPVYRERKGLKSNYLRKLLKQVMPLVRLLPETMPAWLVEKQKLMSRSQALEALHFPVDDTQLSRAKLRLAFEEVFGLTLASLLNKYELLQETALSIPFERELAREFVRALPFDLTSAQRKVVWQIYQDLEKTQPMNRLVEGDVGSGKTVVATMAALMVMKQGLQVALMAPTEILARQHAETIYKLLEHTPYAQQVSLLAGGMKADQKKRAIEHIKSGEIRFIIGTHALIQTQVDMHKLGLVIVDEQHRFGVEHRKKLLAKAGHLPHLLSMTATPIPRTLALTLYGELDISIIDTLPKGRKPITSKIVSPNSRVQVYEQIDAQLAAGRQAFVVCPLISNSDSLAVNSAEAIYDLMRKRDFKHRRIGLLHGKLKTDEKDRVMQAFVDHKLDILVATTVIEVGVNVPNATVMLIEGADRFGLAQIHQLRGRIGRGDHQSYCFLMMSDSKAPSPRLRAVESTQNGFELAELDLELRGPGAIYGTMQHGELDLRIAKLSDTRLIAAARQGAQAFIDQKEDLLQYGQLQHTVKRLRAITNLN